MRCKGWCPPAVIYLTLAIISTVLSLFTSHRHDDMNYDGENKVLYTIIHLIFVGMWTAILYWLCSNCHNTAAWIVLLLPIIVVFFVILTVMFGFGVGAAASHSRYGSYRRVRRVYY
jgi:cell division protein FtsW (lipid II flippase)